MSKLLYFPGSQPSRAVAWFIERHKLDIPFEIVDILKGEQFSPEFTAKNPFQAVPILQLADGSYLAESSAILNFLAASNRIESEYPVSSPIAVARIHEAQGRHEHLTRFVTTKALLPILARLSNPQLTVEDVKATIAKNSGDLAWALTHVDGLLAKTKYIVSDELTVHDYTVTCELNQLPLLEPFLGDNVRVASFPNIARYLEDMKKIDGHDKALATISGMAAKLCS